jgi:MFS transporter, NNP family, nitrate/nitrite transporter
MPTRNDGLSENNGGRTTALGMSTLAFTVCFAVWTIFSIIGIQIKKDLDLTDTQFGLLVGTPILTGSLIRLILGIWADQYGGRVVFVAVMVAAAVATWLLTFAYDYPTFLLASPMSRVGTTRGGRERRSASSAPAMSARQSPSS